LGYLFIEQLVQSHYVRDGLIRVDGPDRATDSSCKGEWIVRGANDQVARDHPVIFRLTEIEVHLLAGRFVEVHLPHIADNADNLISLRDIAEAGHQTSSNGIQAGPELARHGLVYYDNRGSVASI
jgi:hypothetical protein